MPSTVTALAQMADHAATQITASHESWTDFLKTAARLYKYPYHEQLMIFAQRPDATACAGYDVWNDKMRRYIRRGRKGIALIDDSGDRPGIRYVFDVSDTGSRDDSRRPFLWEYRPEHEDAVAAALEQEYEVSGEKGLADQLEQIAGQMAKEYWEDHQYDILHTVDGSFLEEYDEFNIGAQFRNAASVSMTYALMSRCGLEPDEYFEHEDFLSIFDFNTPDTVAALGTAVSEGSQKVLRQIEVTVKNYEREHLAERSATHEEQPDLHEERGLPDSGPDDHGADREHREIRENYLKEHRPVLYNSLLLSEKLYPHLLEIERTATARLGRMMPELMKSAGVTESLKASDPMRWVGLMNDLKAQTEETILTELIYS